MSPAARWKRGVLAPLATSALLAAGLATAARAEDGYELWLRYHPLADERAREGYRAAFSGLLMDAPSPTLRAARDELERGLGGLLDTRLATLRDPSRDGALVVGTKESSPFVAGLDLSADLARAGDEGFLIRSTRIGDRRATVVAANTDTGVLYGVFRLLRLVQTGQPVSALSIVERPRIRYRLLDHWDNLNRTVERGYAGCSLWDWHKLPDYLSPRYTDYARANASIGINGAVLTNVNANAIEPDARVPRQGRGAGRRLPPVRHPRLSHRPLQRPDRDRGPKDRRPARPGGRRLVEAQGRRDLRPRFPTSAAFS